jgi:hypothetical protein
MEFLLLLTDAESQLPCWPYSYLSYLDTSVILGGEPRTPAENWWAQRVIQQKISMAGMASRVLSPDLRAEHRQRLRGSEGLVSTSPPGRLLLSRVALESLWFEAASGTPESVLATFRRCQRFFEGANPEEYTLRRSTLVVLEAGMKLAADPLQRLRSEEIERLLTWEEQTREVSLSSYRDPDPKPLRTWAREQLGRD